MPSPLPLGGIYGGAGARKGANLPLYSVLRSTPLSSSPPATLSIFGINVYACGCEWGYFHCALSLLKSPFHPPHPSLFPFLCNRCLCVPRTPPISDICKKLCRRELCAPLLPHKKSAHLNSLRDCTAPEVIKCANLGGHQNVFKILQLVPCLCIKCGAARPGGQKCVTCFELLRPWRTG